MSKVEIKLYRVQWKRPHIHDAHKLSRVTYEEAFAEYQTKLATLAPGSLVLLKDPNGKDAGRAHHPPQTERQGQNAGGGATMNTCHNAKWERTQASIDSAIARGTHSAEMRAKCDGCDQWVSSIFYTTIDRKRLCPSCAEAVGQGPLALAARRIAPAKPQNLLFDSRAVVVGEVAR